MAKEFTTIIWQRLVLGVFTVIQPLVLKGPDKVSIVGVFKLRLLQSVGVRPLIARAVIGAK